MWVWGPCSFTYNDLHSISSIHLKCTMGFDKLIYPRNHHHHNQDAEHFHQYSLHWITQAPFSEVNWPYTWIHFWTYYYVPWIYVSILALMVHCLDYMSFTVRLEIGLQILLGFFQNCFGYSVSLNFCIHFIWFLNLFICLFIFGCVGSSLLHAGFL